MLETLEHWDKELFLLLNSFHNEIMDVIMFQVSGKLQWIPLYLLLAYLLFKKYGRSSWQLVVVAALLIVASDQISVKLFKEVVERYRPCHNANLQDIVHLVNNKCGGKFGFVSSHATNSFAIASFMGLLLGYKAKKKALYLLLLWASVVSYSRIYLGVHYPGDVIGGALLGLGLAFIFYKVSTVFIITRFKHA